MSSTLINILETSPSYSFDQEISMSSSLALGYIILSFDLILLSRLNHAKLKQISLFTFSIQNFNSQVKLAISNDFDFVRMKYDSMIELKYQKEMVKQTYVYIDKYNHDQSKVQNIRLEYELEDHPQLKEINAKMIKFRFGGAIINYDNSKQTGKFSISNLKYQLRQNNNKNLRVQAFNSSKGLSKVILPHAVCNHQDEQGSFPILYMNQMQNLKSLGQQYFNQLIETLEEYKAPKTTSKENQLFISHDMKDGYYEDTIFTNPLQSKKTNSFRFNYFWHTSTFNYFSHNTISIPPRHWRELCKRYQVKCLGTLIVEADRVDQNYFLSTEFALKLVYLAKKYKFDGYLINIQNPIKNVQLLKEWLKFLTEKIHEEITGSSISWYDSVTADGILDYQNQINAKNKIFYQLTDSFFTNYWWQENKLKDDLKEAQPHKTIYIGNDVWGRGTYGGGQFNIYTAIDQIEKFNQPNKPNLVPALFAPGYTYEQGGQNNTPHMMANEDRLYRGVVFESKELQTWQKPPYPDVFSSLDSNQQWFAKFTQTPLFSQNKKKEKLKITFTYKINSIYFLYDMQLDYKIILRLYDVGKKETVEMTQKERKNVKLSELSVRKIELIIDAEKLTSSTYVQIFVATTIGDVFKEHQLMVSFYFPNIDWIKKIPITKLSLNQSYNSYFNIGYGDYFFFKGKPILKSYNYLADYDLPPTTSLNHPFSTSIQTQDAYIGGSSLVIQPSLIKLFLFDLPSSPFIYPDFYQIKIVSKGGSIDSLYFEQQSGSTIFFQKTSQKSLQHEWFEYKFEMSSQLTKKMAKKFFKYLQTSLMLNIESRCQIGEIFLLPKYLNEEERETSKLELSISQSFQTNNKDQIVIDLELSQISFGVRERTDKKSIRYMVVIDEQFTSFIYISGLKQKGKLRELPLKIKSEMSRVQLYELDDGLQEKLVLKQSVGLLGLKQKYLWHKINIRNY